MENYFEGTLDNLMRWELLDQYGDLASAPEELAEDKIDTNKRPKTVSSLQRDFISLYGSHPKLEDRIYSTCSICEQVFNPQVVSNHKEHCPGKNKIHQSQQIKKKVKSKKKLQVSSVPLPPLFKKESPGPPVLSKFSDISPSPQVSRLAPDVLPIIEVLNPTTQIPEPTTPSSTSVVSPVSPPHPLPSVPPPPPPLPPPPPPPPSLSPSPSPSPAPSPAPAPVPVVEPEEPTSSRHKKSKKSTKAHREYDPDVHCGVVEGQKGPCTRSITCSNHKIQLRKSVPGRSKNIHLLIAEKKAAKEKETRRRSPSHLLAINPKPSSSEDFIYPIVQPEPIICDAINNDNSAELSQPVTVNLTNINQNEMHDGVESDEPSNLESGYCSVETSLSTKSPPVLYFNPISPIFVQVVTTPVQFIQKENSLFVETAPQTVGSPPPSNGYFLTMPGESSTGSNIKLYKSHPKPTLLPTYGTRKVGGAVLSSHQRLEFQRNDIQKAITTKRLASTSNNCKTSTYVPPQRSILLKSKGINKIHKRSSTDKISSSDSKQIKLPNDVNGFILHTEMSEVADSPSNHCIQENINLLNMK